MIFADKLIDLREKNGWSQEDLANKLNVNHQAVFKWENKQSVPTTEQFIQLSELFGVSIDYLVKDYIGQEDPQEDYLEIKHSDGINEKGKRRGYISCIYWFLVMVAYFVWSFIGNSWQLSWIILLIAGVAFGVVIGINRVLRKP